MKIQPQSGLGDLVHALPYILYCLDNHDSVEVATNHGELLEPIKLPKLKVVPVEIRNGWPVEQKDAVKLRYDLYGEPYREACFPADKSLYRTYAENARMIYNSWINVADILISSKKYLLYAPPRAAARHKTFSDINARFQCAPDSSFSDSQVRNICENKDRWLYYLENPGEIYSEKIPDKSLTTHASTIRELFCVIAQAAEVASQVSSITAIAGLIGKDTLFLPSRNETAIQHEKHVNGVRWPGQRRL